MTEALLSIKLMLRYWVKMIDVGLLIQDKGIQGLDLSAPEKGNPGIGGTEYCFLLLAKFLNEDEDFDVTIYHFGDNKLPSKDIVCEDEEDALKKASANSGKTLMIIKNLQEPSFYDLFDKYDLNYVMWCHNFLTYEEMNFFYNNERVKRCICVGRQMYDYYVDHRIIDKMEYCFNMVIPGNTSRIKEYDNNVTYIGSLISQKHFHILAKHWKEIVREVPGAKLHVIGSGKLYDRTSKLGPLSVADIDYENEFLPYLEEDGKLMSSVIFHGILGADKRDEVFENTAVGVVNPMAATETFCLGAVEMEAVGIPVVTRKKNGLLDTVRDNETGLLYNDESELAQKVIALLKNHEYNESLGKNASNFARNEFLPEKIIPKWKNVLKEIADGRKAVYHKPVNHFENNGKRIRMFIHSLHRIPFLKRIPSIHDIQKK